MKQFGVLVSILFIGACGTIVNPDLDLCERPQDKVASVTVTPRTWTLDKGDTLTLHADVVNRNGEWNLCMPDAAWTSSDSTIVTARSGFLPFYGAIAIGIRPGSVYLKASAQGKSDSMQVTVRN